MSLKVVKTERTAEPSETQNSEGGVNLVVRDGISRTPGLTRGEGFMCVLHSNETIEALCFCHA